MDVHKTQTPEYGSKGAKNSIQWLGINSKQLLFIFTLECQKCNIIECCLGWIQSNTWTCKWCAQLWCLLCVLGRVYVMHSDSFHHAHHISYAYLNNFCMNGNQKPLKILDKRQLYNTEHVKCIEFYSQVFKSTKGIQACSNITSDMSFFARKYLKCFERIRTLLGPALAKIQEAQRAPII